MPKKKTSRSKTANSAQAATAQKDTQKPSESSDNSEAAKPENLRDALAQFQARFEGVELRRLNPFHGNRYASLDDIVKDTKPLLEELGITYHFVMSRFSDGQVLHLHLFHDSGEQMSGIGNHSIGIETQDRTPQQIGSQITYFKRFLLTTALNLRGIEHDDDGNEAAAEPDTAIGEATMLTINNLVEETGADSEALLAFCKSNWNVDALDELSRPQANQIINMLKSKMRGADHATTD